jgi:ribosomal protein S25
VTSIIVSFVGDALKKLEERGVVIRFVIGRRFSLAL